jgi:hypothetical protein
MSRMLSRWTLEWIISYLSKGAEAIDDDDDDGQGQFQE